MVVVVLPPPLLVVVVVEPKDVVLVPPLVAVVTVMLAVVVVLEVGGMACGMNGSLVLNVESASTAEGAVVAVDAPVVGVVAGNVTMDRLVPAVPPLMQPTNTHPIAKASMTTRSAEVRVFFLTSSPYWLVGAAVVAVEPAAVVAVVLGCALGVVAAVADFLIDGFISKA